MAKPFEKTIPPQFRETGTASHGDKKMGLVYADIELISGDDLVLHRHGYIKDDEIRRMTVNALVDSGALMLAINEEISTHLGLQKVGTRTAQLADGTLIEVEVVGPVEVRFANRQSSVRAMVLPGDAEPLLGVIPMEDMDVLVDPQQRRLIVNPEHPYTVQVSLKSAEFRREIDEGVEWTESSPMPEGENVAYGVYDNNIVPLALTPDLLSPPTESEKVP